MFFVRLLLASFFYEILVSCEIFGAPQGAGKYCPIAQYFTYPNMGAAQCPKLKIESSIAGPPSRDPAVTSISTLPNPGDPPPRPPLKHSRQLESHLEEEVTPGGVHHELEDWTRAGSERTGKTSSSRAAGKERSHRRHRGDTSRGLSRSLSLGRH